MTNREPNSTIGRGVLEDLIRSNDPTSATTAAAAPYSTMDNTLQWLDTRVAS
jgi:hypothetical protein